MRKVKRKILGVILTLAMVLGMCPVVGVYADGQEGTSASISVSIGEASESMGLVQVKKGDNWTDYSTGSVEAEAVRIRPNQGYNIDWTGIGLRVAGSDILTEDIRSQLASDEGYTLENGKAYALENVEFKSDDGNSENPAPPSSQNGLSFKCQSNSVSGGSIYYKLNNSGDFIKVAEDNGNYGNVTVPSDTTSITVKLVANEGYQLDGQRGISLYVNGNRKYSQSGDSISDFTSEAGHTFNVSDIVDSGSAISDSRIELEFGFENSSSGGGENPNPGGNEDCIGFAFEGELGTDYSALVEKGIGLYVAVSSDETKPAEGEFRELSKLVNVGGDVTQAGSAYKFNSSVRQVYAYLKYDTSKYMSQAGYGSQINIGVGYENASRISATGINTIQVDKIHYTVTWAYDAKRFGEDAYLEHGKAYITAINGVSVDELTFDAIWGDNPGNTEGGNLAVEPGSTVTVKLIPDYGYQLKSVSLNGNELTPQSDVSTFTFKMPATQVHFKGAFEKSTDVVTTQGDTVSNAIINNASNATDSGNISLEVKDNSTYSTKDAEVLVTDSVSAEAVDLNLNQIVSKGNGSNWETAITEFSKPVTLTLGLKDYDSSYDYTVVRNHNGQLTKLDTSVSDGKVTFDTNRFSTYVIVKSEKKKTSTIGTGTSMGEGAPETKLSQSADELLGLICLTNEEKAAIKERGADADITLDIESTSPSNQELALIKKVLGENNIAEYYDISLLLKVDGIGQRQITDPDGKIKIAITIPEKFLNTDKNIKRTYHMVRIHDGKATVIEGSFDAVTKQFTFETDAFSTYALVYEDTTVEAKTNITKPANTTNTDTKPTTKVKKAVKGGDSNNLLVWYTVLLLGVAGITAATLYRRRKTK